VTSEPEQEDEGRNDSSDAAGGGAADHPTQNSDQQQYLTVAPETEVTNDNADGNAALDMQQYGWEWDADSLIAGQRNNPDIKVIVSLLKQITDKPAWKDVELQFADVKSLYTEWPRLAFRSGLLCRQWTELTGRIVWKIMLPRPHRAEFVKIVHSGMTGGHLGRYKTEVQVRQRAYWPGWKRQVETELKRWQQCAQHHRGCGPKQTPLTPFCSGYPWEMISIDITGPHPKSARGNEYMITVVDVFSKWAEAFPVRNHTAPTVAKVLVDQVFFRWGTPARILMDNGPEFHSDLFSEVCKLLEVDKLHTTPYHPQTNGCVERFHLTLNRMLGKVESEKQKDWDSHLSAVLCAYRASKHESARFTPYELVMGQKPRMLIDSVLGSIAEDRPKHETYVDYVEDLRERLIKSHQIAREHLDTAADRRKQKYDLKVKPRSFQVGEKVWYLYPRRYTARSPKWQKHCIGPFKVVKVLPPADYVIRKSKRSEPMVVHADKLKTCYSDTPTTSLQPTDDSELAHTVTASTAQPDEQQTNVSQSATPAKRPIKSRAKRQVEAAVDNLTVELDAGLDVKVGRPEVDRPRRQRNAPRCLDVYQLY